MQTSAAKVDTVIAKLADSSGHGAKLQEYAGNVQNYSQLRINSICTNHSTWLFQEIIIESWQISWETSSNGDG